MKKYAHLTAKALQENFKNQSKYVTQFFNQHSKYKKEPKPSNPSDPDPELTSATSPAGNDQHGGYSDNSNWYKEMKVYWTSYDTSTTTSYGYHSNGSYFSVGHSFKPSIGEDKVPVPKDSTSKSFMQYLDEIHHENDLFHKLAQKQAQKLHQEYQHELAEFQKVMELERQQENLPIYMIEFATAKVFLQYYANMALQKPAPPLKIEQVIQVAKYLAATITCELRHRNRKCAQFWSRALHMWTMLDDWGVTDGHNRQDAGKMFLSGSTDWDGFMVERYLKLGAYIFGGKWEGGYGGWPWASVAWYASEWVFHAVTKGDIPVILWEKMLNAAHNNGRWMNKLGMGNVMGVLNMGANASPSFITEIAKKALIVDNPNDFRRVIEKWAQCDLPGEKNKLELPNPGVEVEVHRMRSSSRQSYIEQIKKQEEKAKEKTVVLDAPDKAPVELKEGEKISPTSKPTLKPTYSVEDLKQVLLKSVEGKKAPDVLKKGITLPWKIDGSPLKPPQSFGLTLDVITQAFAFQLEKQNPLLGVKKVPIPDGVEEVNIGELIKEKLSPLKKKIFAPKPAPYPEYEVKPESMSHHKLSVAEYMAKIGKSPIPQGVHKKLAMDEKVEVAPVVEMKIDLEAAEKMVATLVAEQGQAPEVEMHPEAIELQPIPVSPIPPPEMPGYELKELKEGHKYPKPHFNLHEPPEIKLQKAAASSPNKYSTKGDGFTLVEEWEETSDRTSKKEGETHEQVAAG